MPTIGLKNSSKLRLKFDYTHTIEVESPDSGLLVTGKDGSIELDFELERKYGDQKNFLVFGNDENGDNVLVGQMWDEKKVVAVGVDID